jgi:hypothetical protein
MPATEGPYELHKSGSIMRIQVLVPASTAEQCLLIEAAYWLGFRRYPIAAYEAADHKIIDLRNDRDSLEGSRILVPSEEIINDVECQYAGLDLNPEYEKLSKGDDIPFTPQELAEMQKYMAGEPTFVRPRVPYEQMLAESEQFHALLGAWNEALEAYLEPHKARIYLALHEGRLRAAGRPIPTQTLDAAEEWVGDDIAVELRGLEPIPAAFWRAKGIDWEFSRASGQGGCYCQILIDFGELLELYPATVQPPPWPVAFTGSAYVLASTEQLRLPPPQSPLSKSPGRPPKVDWLRFDVEVVRRMLRKEFWQEKDAFATEMRSWCHTVFKTNLSSTTVKDRLRPFHDLMDEIRQDSGKQ